METKNTKTKYDIIRVASECFLEKGYSVTSLKMIARELKISPGNVTYYFQTKEHVLLSIVEMLLDYEWRIFTKEIDNGLDTLSAACLEFVTTVASCQQNPIIKDLFISIYESEMCRVCVRNHRIERSRRIAKEQGSDWNEEQMTLAEIMIRGIFYSMITTDDSVVTLETRVAGALRLILSIYNEDEESKNRIIKNILQTDYQKLGKRVMDGFVNFVKVTNEKTMEDFLNGKKILETK